MNKRGVTLIELLVVIAILGIIAMIAIPTYTGTRARAMRSEAYSNLQNLRLLEEQFFAENSCYYMVGNVCTNAAISTVVQGNPPAVRFNHLPGFRPGGAATLNFTYTITTSTAAGGGSATAFIATATGKAGTKVAGEAYTINQDNVRTPPF